MHRTLVAHAAKVDRIEPTDWYVGMKNPSLQLMIYGKDVRDANVTVDYPGVRIDSLVRLDSPNYLLVYLNVADAKAGEMVLKIDRQRVKYQLKQREKRGEERIGFTCADVLYQLMPDRDGSSTYHGYAPTNYYRIDPRFGTNDDYRPYKGHSTATS